MRRGPSDKSILVHKNPRRVKTTLYKSEKTTQTLVQKYIVNDSKNKKYLTSLTKWRIRKKNIYSFSKFWKPILFKSDRFVLSFFYVVKKLSVFFSGGGQSLHGRKQSYVPDHGIPGYFHTDTYPDVLLPDG